MTRGPRHGARYAATLPGGVGLVLLEFGATTPQLVTPAKAALVLLGLGMTFAGASRLGKRWAGPRFDLVFWFGAGRLILLGLAIQPPEPTRGNMIAEGEGRVFEEHPHIVLVPGASLFLTVFAFSTVGEKARRRWDSRSVKPRQSDHCPGQSNPPRARPRC